MSGQPNRDAVKKLKMALNDLTWNREKLHNARLQEAEVHGQVLGYEDGVAKANQEIDRLMDEMDVRATGNHGYEERRLKLLLWLAQEHI